MIEACRGGHLALSFYAPGERSRAHSHAGAQISLVLTGGYHEEGAAGRLVAEDGVLTGKPAGFEHENQFSDAGALILSVNLTEAPFLTRHFAVPRPEGIDHIALRAAAWAGEPALENLGAMRGLPRADFHEQPRLEAARRRLLAEGQTRTATVARTLGLHPVRFARLFRDAYGRTPADLRQAGRIGRAIDRIVRSGDGLAEIAAAEGFADQAHMTRQIRRATGYPPARLRRLFRPD
ncbi:AraC family transcriptional regulator [Caulobacter sp. 17J65-9]|uniref:helix-turn-helix domain-containing protein n=1 Tax=Caulobacter sp. 17J65-9 TaxID=2709382 RepID=UPI003204BA2E